MPDLVALAVAFVYAFVRYVVFKGVPLAHVPLYVTDKAIAVAALFAFSRAIASLEPETRRASARRGLVLSTIHVVASLPLLTPGYLPRLFSDPHASTGFNFTGESTIVLGVLSFGLALVVSIPRPSRSDRPRTKAPTALHNAVIALAVLHCAALGYANWLDPSHWPGLLPPITLLSALVGIVALASSTRRSIRARS
jgi:hypothetical protein